MFAPVRHHGMGAMEGLESVSRSGCIPPQGILNASLFWKRALQERSRQALVPLCSGTHEAVEEGEPRRGTLASDSE